MLYQKPVGGQAEQMVLIVHAVTEIAPRMFRADVTLNLDDNGDGVADRCDYVYGLDVPDRARAHRELVALHNAGVFDGKIETAP